MTREATETEQRLLLPFEMESLKETLRFSEDDRHRVIVIAARTAVDAELGAADPEQLEAIRVHLVESGYEESAVRVEEPDMTRVFMYSERGAAFAVVIHEALGSPNAEWPEGSSPVLFLEAIESTWEGAEVQ